MKIERTLGIKYFCRRSFRCYKRVYENMPLFGQSQLKYNYPKVISEYVKVTILFMTGRFPWGRRKLNEKRIFHAV